MHISLMSESPCGGRPVRAPPIMYSQATGRSNTKDRAVLRRDCTLKHKKGKKWFARTIVLTSMNRDSAVVGHCTAISPGTTRVK